MQRFDTIVVGGGPAGSSLAWALQQVGQHVLVIDKQAFPRHKTCAGWITPSVVETLALPLDNYASSHTLQPVDGFRIGQIGNEPVDIDYEQPVSYGIRRCEFDDYLLKRCDAELRTGEAVKAIDYDGDRWTINGTYSAPMLIGAGGHFCPVARHLGARPGKSETAVAAQELEFELSDEQLSRCRVDPQRPELYFAPDLEGYGWILIKGKYLNIGLGRENTSGLATHVRSFCEWLRQQGRFDFDLPEHFNGHAYLLYNHSERKTVDEGVLLIGDAAGLAFPQSGEGIRPAIESGLLAAKTIETAAGDYRASRLARYPAEIKNRFGERNSMTDTLLPSHLKQLLAKYLLHSRWFDRNVVINQWFLHTDLPSLHG